MFPLIALAIIGSTQVGPNTVDVDYLTQDSTVITITQSKEQYVNQTNED